MHEKLIVPLLNSKHMVFVNDVSGGQEQTPVSFVNDVDFDHLPSNWTYSAVSVPGPGANTDDFETGFIGCTCRDGICSVIDCPCRLLNRTIECGDFCTCSDGCSNRKVQHGVRVQLQIFKTQERGFGLRTLEHLDVGCFVCEYASEVVGQEEARNRVAPNPGVNYLLVLKEHISGGNTLLTYFDPRYIGNVGRFINHSCCPNMLSTPVRATNAVPRVCFYTLRDVDPMEELTYNYAGSHGERNYRAEQPSICKCGAPQCLGFLPFEPSVP